MNIKMHSFVRDLERLTSYQPDKIALLDSEGRTFTYRALLEQVERAHAWFASMGLRPGDTLIALLPNSLETVILFLASLRGGYTYAPLPCTSTVTEVRQWKNLTRARFCVLAKPVSTSLQESIIKMDWPVKIINIGDEISWPANDDIDLVSGGRLIIASSGSTGEPKAMLLDGDRLWSSAHAFLCYHQIENEVVRFWNYLPMSYLGGLFNLTLIPLAAGGSIFIDEAFTGKTFLVFWSTVEHFEINSLWLVPSILRGLLTLSLRVGQARPHPKIKHCYLGTAPISLEEKQKFSQVFGIQPLENYGLSETTFISSERVHEIALRRQGTVGRVMPNVELKLIDSEIWVRTPYMMLGYIDSDGIVELSIDIDGFLCTGDLGQMVDGQLQLSGRRRDIIKKGGILIALREIELLAESYSNVAEAAAVKIEHDFYGESYTLFVRTCEKVKDRAQFVSQLGAWIHENLVRHKWPENIIYCKDFPRTASGKIQKHLLNVENINNG